MSDSMPVPSPSPEPSAKPSTKPEENKSFWGHVADVADFLFATKSLGRILTGEGGWGDLANVGITAASFFIPPARLLKFGAKPLESIIAHAAEVAVSDTASVAAKKAAARTADNARYLLENPAKHEELAKLAQTTDNPELAKLNNLHAEADHFLSTGTVPEAPVKRVGDSYQEPVKPEISQDLEHEFKAMKEAESTGTIDKRIASGEEPSSPVKEAPAVNPDSDAAKYFHLTEEEIANYRAAGKSEEYIANQNNIEEQLSKAKLPEGDKVLGDTEKGRVNAVHEVQAEMPVTADGKPITRRMEDAMPEDMRTGNLQVDRTAWLISESKKLENFLKKKPANAGEIRATKDLWNKQANALQKDMTVEERVEANKLADDLTERSLADYKAGKDTLKRGVVDFNVGKETDVAKLTDARTKLIDDWRTETDPDLKRAIAFTGKKVAARIKELTGLTDMQLVDAKLQTERKMSEKFTSQMDQGNPSDVYTKNDEFSPDFVASKNPETKDATSFIERSLSNSSDFQKIITGTMNDTEVRSTLTKLANELNIDEDHVIHRYILEKENRHAIDTALRDYPEKSQVLISMLKDIKDNHQIGMATYENDLADLFKTGKRSNRYEANNSVGNPEWDKRKVVEGSYFELQKDIHASKRPVYGFMFDPKNPIKYMRNKQLMQYGNFRMVLKPEVKERSFFTVGDSFLEDQIPVALTSKVEGKELLNAVPNQILNTVNRIDPRLVTPEELLKKGVYVETQIFNGITLKDIEKVFYKKSSDLEKLVQKVSGENRSWKDKEAINYFKENFNIEFVEL